jgi:hypothetical protein
MPVILNDEVTDLLNDDATTKVLATVDGDGVPHVVIKQSLHSGGDGAIHLLELLESSTTGRNLVRSIWYDRPLAIALKGKDGRSVQIKGRAVQNHIAGPLFEYHYLKVREQYGDIDLAGVWVIQPDQVIDQGFGQRLVSENAAHPTYIHLDRIAKQEGKPDETN